MDDDKLIAAVRAVEQRCWSPAPIEMVADAAGWRGAGIEHELGRLANAGRIELHKRHDHDPSYASRQT
jgi:hypothetical protein